MLNNGKYKGDRLDQIGFECNWMGFKWYLGQRKRRNSKDEEKNKPSNYFEP